VKLLEVILNVTVRQRTSGATQCVTSSSAAMARLVMKIFLTCQPSVFPKRKVLLLILIFTLLYFTLPLFDMINRMDNTVVTILMFCFCLHSFL
jgi:hypothetical protein